MFRAAHADNSLGNIIEENEPQNGTDRTPPSQRPTGAGCDIDDPWIKPSRSEHA
jgi:hypothetical protein